jgi:hypothetical protein
MYSSKYIWKCKVANNSQKNIYIQCFKCHVIWCAVNNAKYIFIFFPRRKKSEYEMVQRGRIDKTGRKTCNFFICFIYHPTHPVHHLPGNGPTFLSSYYRSLHCEDKNLNCSYMKHTAGSPFYFYAVSVIGCKTWFFLKLGFPRPTAEFAQIWYTTFSAVKNCPKVGLFLLKSAETVAQSCQSGSVGENDENLDPSTYNTFWTGIIIYSQLWHLCVSVKPKVSNLDYFSFRPFFMSFH